MAWTEPKEWLVNETVTAANMNTHLRDNLNALSIPATQFIEMTNEQSTSSASFVDMPDALGTITTERHGNIFAQFVGHFETTSVQIVTSVELRFTIGGTATSTLMRDRIIEGGIIADETWIQYRWTGLNAGSHIIRVQWKSNGGTIFHHAGSITGVLLLTEWG